MPGVPDTYHRGTLQLAGPLFTKSPHESKQKVPKKNRSGNCMALSTNEQRSIVTNPNKQNIKGTQCHYTPQTMQTLYAQQLSIDYIHIFFHPMLLSHSTIEYRLYPYFLPSYAYLSHPNRLPFFRSLIFIFRVCPSIHTTIARQSANPTASTCGGPTR
jgi:hypothetical protein